MDSSYTNSFGQFGAGVSSSNSGASNGVGPIMSAPSEPVVSGGGDVVLAPSGSAKKKRWPIVVGLFAVLTIAAVVVAVIIIGNDNSIATQTKREMNKYSNYVINGTISTDAISGEYDEQKLYELSFRLDDYKNNQEYFDNLSELYKNFKNKYNELVASSNANKVGDIEEAYNSFMVEQSDRLEFILNYARIGRLKDGDIIRILVDDGVSGAQKYMSDFYDQYLSGDVENENYLDRLYYDNQIEYGNAQIAVYGYYLENGCIDKSTYVVNQSCADELALPGEIFLQKASLDNDESFVISLVYSNVNVMIESIFNNNTWINGGAGGLL